MTELTSKRTVPQIFFNEKHVGGNDDFQKLVKFIKISIGRSMS